MRELSFSLLLVTWANSLPLTFTPPQVHDAEIAMNHCIPCPHLVLVRICRSISSLPRAFSRSRACVWSAPSPDILSSCFLTESTSSSQDILAGPADLKQHSVLQRSISWWQLGRRSGVWVFRVHHRRRQGEQRRLLGWRTQLWKWSVDSNPIKISS